MMAVAAAIVPVTKVKAMLSMTLVTGQEVTSVNTRMGGTCHDRAIAAKVLARHSGVTAEIQSLEGECNEQALRESSVARRTRSCAGGRRYGAGNRDGGGEHAAAAWHFVLVSVRIASASSVQLFDYGRHP